MTFLPRELMLKNRKQSLIVTSLFPYKGGMRKLIHLSKISNNPVAIYCLEIIFIHFSKKILLLKPLPIKSSLFTPPSSSWGRWRGRYDLAFFLTVALKNETGAKIGKRSRTKLFPIQKQAQMSQKTRDLLACDFQVIASSQSKVHLNQAAYNLIIDDIMATGNTLWKARSSKWLKNQACAGLTLCYSPSRSLSSSWSSEVYS